MDNLIFSHGGDIYGVKRKYGKEVIDFSANINPLGLPPEAKKVIARNFDSILHYPDPQLKDISRRIAQYWGIKEENILVGNGSIELIYLLTSCFKPRASLIAVPGFSEYERAARIVKSRIRFLELKEEGGFKLDLSRIPNSDIFFFSNPNNPTGNLILDDYCGIERLPNGLLVVDEAFMDFVPQEKDYTLIYKAQKFKKIAVLRTFTKFFALPGLRIGYLIAHKDIIRALKQHQMPWSVNALAQRLAEVMLNNETYIKKTRLFIVKEREFLFDALKKIKGLIPYPSVANFLLLKIVDENINSSELTNKLIQRGILIRNCSNFRGLDNKFIRIAVRSRKENLRLIDALKETVCKT